MSQITTCPLVGCGKSLHYVDDKAVCDDDHRFAHYRAIGGLLPIGEDYRPTGAPMFVPHDDVMRVLDISARLWNALVWYSGDKRKFWNRLLELMGTLRDEAHTNEDERFRHTQMDIEYERLREALSRGTP